MNEYLLEAGGLVQILAHDDVEAAVKARDYVETNRIHKAAVGDLYRYPAEGLDNPTLMGTPVRGKSAGMIPVPFFNLIRFQA